MEVDVCGYPNQLVIEDNNEFTLRANDYEFKAQFPQETLNKLKLNSLKDMGSKYRGKLFLVCFDENKEVIELLLETGLEFQHRN